MPYLTATTTLLAQTNRRNELLTGTYAAIDTEYRFNPNNKTKQYTIFAVSVVDSLGNVKVRHESHYSAYPNPERELVEWLMREILKYRLTIGWYSKGVRLRNEETGTYSGKDSDLKIIDDACRYHNIPSIIGFDKRGVPYVRGYDYHLCKTSQKFAFLNKFDWYYHIDLYQIYKKPMVKNMIYNNRYRDLDLGSVSMALLGEGKLAELDGLQIQSLPTDKQIEYVAQDANLVMKLSKHNNYEILDLMNAISIITKVPFDRVCHTGISTWWKNILINYLNSRKCRVPSSKVQKQTYKGGQVIVPLIGDYKNQLVYVLDVKSLYPTMIIINNISFETVNCDCCKGKSEARVSAEIMDLINNDLPDDQIRECYWICREQNYNGIIPRLLTQYREERFRKQELGDESTQLALKNLINGVYGLLGSKFFEFSDYRVAELTTAFGRQTLQYMQHIAEEVYGLKVIYGDTDSIFVTGIRRENDIKKFLAECSIVLEDIDIEVSKIYNRTVITKKKHYIGIHQDSSKEPDIKGMEGIKSDRPFWINQLQKEFVDDLRYDKDPTIKLQNAYIEMERGLVHSDLLVITSTLKKDPDAYSKNAYQRIIGNQVGAKEGDTIKYYKSTNSKAHSNPALLSRAKYLDMMKSTFEEQLKVLGYDFIKDVAGVKSLADIPSR